MSARPPVDVMIVGLPRCSSTSLVYYLGSHPGIHEPTDPEMTWFLEEDAAREPFPERRYFREGSGLRLGKLASMVFYEHSLDLLQRLSPDVHCVIVLRDPVDTVRSRAGFITNPVRLMDEHPFWMPDEVAGDDDPLGKILERSRYDLPVAALHERFGRDAVTVLISEELRTDPRAAVAPLADRLGLDPAGFDATYPHSQGQQIPRNDQLHMLRYESTARRWIRAISPPPVRRALRRAYRRLNRGAVKPVQLTAAQIERIDRYFQGPNAALEELIGRPIPAWHRRSGEPAVESAP